MRERSKEISISLISRLACSSTSRRKTPAERRPTLLVESHDSSGNSLANSYFITALLAELTVDLSNATTTLHSDADVKIGKTLSTEQQHRLNSLHSHALGLHHVDGLAVELHDSVAILAVSNGNGSLLQGVRNQNAQFVTTHLTTESLNRWFRFAGHRLTITTREFWHRRIEGGVVSRDGETEKGLF